MNMTFPGETRNVADAVTDPQLRLLYGYWCSKKRGRAMPSRTDIDPVDLPGSLWPHLILLDVVPEDASGEARGPRFRYRVLGSTFMHAFARNPTGEFLDEALPARNGYSEYVTGIYRDMVALKKGIYTENSFTLDGQAVPMFTRRLSLPLSSDGETVNMALASALYEYDRSPIEGYLSDKTGFRAITRVVLDD